MLSRKEYSVEYRAYKNAKARCNNLNRPDYEHYGGRGIKFKFESFEDFFSCVGKKPASNYKLDRIDNNGHYESGNIRWTTTETSNQNRRYQKRNKLKISGVYIKHNRQDGQDHIVAIESTGHKYTVLYSGYDFFEACCARKSWELSNAPC